METDTAAELLAVKVLAVHLLGIVIRHDPNPKATLDRLQGDMNISISKTTLTNGTAASQDELRHKAMQTVDLMFSQITLTRG